MALAQGKHTVGPGDGTLEVKTYREGMASKAGHDLVIAVTRWQATVELDAGRLEFEADPRSLEVRHGLGGVKPLSDKDRIEIRKTIDAKVLGAETIVFRSTDLRADAGSLLATGDLTVNGATRRVTATLTAEPDGRIHGTVPVTQTDHGITPYRGLMGALKVRDAVEIEVDVRLPASTA
jgi:polyisoprenoid-binding protein YceI